jgi:hypothetical protein
MTGRILLTAANGRPVDITTQIGDLFEWARLGRLSAPEIRPWARRLGAQLYTSLEAVMNLGRLPILRVCHYLASLTRVT